MKIDITNQSSGKSGGLAYRNTIYSAPTVEQAEANLINFGEKWDVTHSRVSQSWQNNWQRIIPYFAYPPEIRRVIYTTNAIDR